MADETRPDNAAKPDAPSEPAISEAAKSYEAVLKAAAEAEDAVRNAVLGMSQTTADATPPNAGQGSKQKGE